MKDFRWKTMGRLGNNLFQWAFLYAIAKQGIIPDIYVQNPVFFLGYEDEIKQQLQAGCYFIDDVAIHVRRGDYVNNSFYVDLMKTNYYKKAMEHFTGEKFLVFSDDIKWCKKQAIFKGCSFDESKSEEEAFNAMQSCKAHIISNSSFSWWAAFSSPHGGKVIAPKAWYADGIERTAVPKEWTRI